MSQVFKTKRKILVLGIALALLTFAAISAFTAFHINTAKASDARTTTLHLAFTGIVTNGISKDTPITGGLTEIVRSTGYFNGNLHQPDGTQISTSGKIFKKQIEITFYDALGTAVIRGQGHLSSSGNYIGTFQVYYSDNHIDTGLWSALPVTHTKEVIALDFVGIDTDGLDASSVYTGAIILNDDTLAGTFNLPNGASIPVVAKVGSKGTLTVTFRFSSSSKIVGTGAHSHVSELTGYSGTFVGPNSSDAGNWVAYKFRF